MFLGLLNLTGVLSALLGCISLVLAAVFLSMNIAWYDICEMKFKDNRILDAPSTTSSIWSFVTSMFFLSS